jgi:hypothetical protein
MAQDEEKAESGEFQPTLTDTLHSSLKLPESEGRVVLLLVLLDELFNDLIKREVLSSEEVGGILDRAGDRVRVAGERAKRESYEAGKGRNYPQSYVDELMDRRTVSAEKALSRIRERLANKPDQ